MIGFFWWENEIDIISNTNNLLTNSYFEYLEQVQQLPRHCKWLWYYDLADEENILSMDNANDEEDFADEYDTSLLDLQIEDFKLEIQR